MEFVCVFYFFQCVRCIGVFLTISSWAGQFGPNFSWIRKDVGHWRAVRRLAGCLYSGIHQVEPKSYHLRSLSSSILISVHGLKQRVSGIWGTLPNLARILPEFSKVFYNISDFGYSHLPDLTNHFGKRFPNFPGSVHTCHKWDAVSDPRDWSFVQQDEKVFSSNSRWREKVC